MGYTFSNAAPPRFLNSFKNAPFVEGLVEEVIFDPLYLKEQDLLPNENDQFLEVPANSVLFRVLNDNRGDKIHLAYPMFPSHFTMPVKVGEIVWILTIGNRFYWLCRKISNGLIEDVNITRDSRFGTFRFLESKDEADSIEGNKEINIPGIPSPDDKFFEDGEVSKKLPLFHEYISEKISSVHVLEAVPRYTKRPGDFVIQGSNNTLISLGRDGRGWNKSSSTGLASTAWNEPSDDDQYSGTIDIVTGRGRYLLDSDKYLKPGADVNSLKPPSRTSPYIIENSLGKNEVDKARFSNVEDNIDKNLVEGDPDFGYDASRLYISSKTQPDTAFDLSLFYPKIPAWDSGELGTSSDVPIAGEQASIVAKSDQIRIISRYLDPEEELFSTDFENSLENATKINGSIKIIKEGTRDDSGHSTLDGNGSSIIAMQPDGVVMIDGSSIIIGSGRESDANGEGNQIFLGADAEEPLVLGTQLQTLLTDFFDAVKSWLQNNFDTHVHPTGVGPSGPPTVIGADAGTGMAKDNVETILSKIGKTK